MDSGFEEEDVMDKSDWIFFSFILAVLLCIIGLECVSITSNYWKQEAVNNCVAEWVVDNHGSVSFRWKHPVQK